MTDDTPTQRLPETADATGELVEERKKSKALLFTLVGVGAALLIAIVVLLIILFSGGTAAPGSTPTASDTPITSPSPSDSPTPSATPTPTPTPTATATPTAAPAPPPDTSPGFASFNRTGTVECQSPPSEGGGPVAPPNPQVKFSWSAKNAQSVWFQFGVGDAADAGAYRVPLSGNQDDVYGSAGSMEFPCYQAEQKYTLTVVGNNGQHVNKSFTVKNDGWVQ
jgi:hypothetical protein